MKRSRAQPGTAVSCFRSARPAPSPVFLTNALDSGLSLWKWMVSLDVGDSSILKRPHHGHSRKKIAKVFSNASQCQTIQAIVEKEGVLSGLVKLG
jgi:hypothetical protein